MNALYQGRIIILLSMAKVVMYVAGRGWLTLVCITDACEGISCAFVTVGRLKVSDETMPRDTFCVSVNIGHFFVVTQ